MNLKKTNKLSFKLLLFFILISVKGCAPLFAQPPIDDRFENVVQPPPNAGSLGRFGDIPVSYFTGTPNIDIPIYEIHSGNLKIPISISYHSGGIPIAQVASWVGMGWALNSGGVVSRTIRGKADNGSGSDVQAMGLGSYPIPDSASLQLVRSYYQNIDDSRPDDFFYTLADPSQSGKFVFDHNQTIYTYPKKPLKITWHSGGLQNLGAFGINDFNIIDEQGNTYDFSNYEVTQINDGSGFFGRNQSIAWYPTSITSADKSDTILFLYTKTGYHYTLASVYSEYFNLNRQTYGDLFPLKFTTNGASFQSVIGQRLTKIVFRGGSISFIANTERYDVISDFSENTLDEIDINDAQGNIVKRFKFTYEYLGTVGYDETLAAGSFFSPTAAYQTTTAYRNQDMFRLFLKSVQEFNSDGTQSKPPYQFDYENSAPMLARTRLSGDWGGFNNGELGFENVSDTSDPMGTSFAYNLGHTFNFLYAKQCSLNKITYPTGGSTSFEYEPNLQNIYPDKEIHPGKSFGPNYLAGDFTKQNLMNTNGLFDFSIVSSNPNDRIPVSFTITQVSADPVGRPGIIIYLQNKDNGANYVSFGDFDDCTSGNGCTLNGTNEADYSLYLPPGNYRVKGPDMSGVGSNPFDYQVTASGKINQYPDTTVMLSYGLGQGLRIKNMANYDVTGNIIGWKRFTYPGGIGFGDLMRANSYQFLEDRCTLSDDGGFSSIGCPLVPYLATSFSNLYSTDAAYIGYGAVIEKDSGNVGNGHTEYDYYIGDNDDRITFNATNLPFPPTYNRTWKRGLLRQKSIYKTVGNTDILQRQEIYYYSPSVITKSVAGDAIMPRVDPNIMMSDNNPGTWSQFIPASPDNERVQQNYFSIRPYTIPTGYCLLDSSRITDYDDYGNANSTLTSYIYDTSILLPKLIKKIDSKNQYNISNIKYPGNYSISGTPGNSFAQGMKNLQDLHVVSEPIEVYNQLSNLDGSNLRTASAIIKTYKPAIPQPDSILQWEPALPEANFTPSQVSSSSIIKDGKYAPRLSFNQYDTYGNILEQQKANDVKEVYLWGYNAQYPVAKIVGSDYNTVKAHVDTSMLNTGTEAQIEAQLATLRSYFAGNSQVQVTTYTYAPLIGILSETDPNGNITKYEYDSFGRLKDAKDKDGHVIKKYDYHYQGQ